MVQLLSSAGPNRFLLTQQLDYFQYLYLNGESFDDITVVYSIFAFSVYCTCICFIIVLAQT